MLWHVQPWWCYLLVMQAQQGEQSEHCDCAFMLALPTCLVRNALLVVLLHFHFEQHSMGVHAQPGMHCLAAADALAG